MLRNMYLDAENYLKRFIDIEYNLPEPSYEDFCNYLYDKFEIFKYTDKLVEVHCFNIAATKLFQHNKLSLREMEKIYSHASLAISCNKQLKCDSIIFLFFVFIKVCHSDIYKSFEQKKYEKLQEFINALEPLLPNTPNDITLSSNIIADAICMYFSQLGIFTEENINSAIDQIISQKIDKVKIKKGVKRFLQIYSPQTAYETLTQFIDLLINFN